MGHHWARVALAASGRRVATAVVAALEAVTFMLVFNLIASNLDAIDRLVGYALGVAAGTLVGLYANDRLSSGQSVVHAIVSGHRPNFGPALHDLGWPATTHDGAGPRGPITTALIVVNNARLAEVTADIRSIAPDGFVTVHQLRRVHPVPVPDGFHQVGTRRRTTDHAIRITSSVTVPSRMR